MNDSATQPLAARTARDTRRVRLDLFLVSLLILFLELASIRWFPAHVLFLTFFTNTVLLACFLGMSLGCLSASRDRDHLAWTPYALVVALGAGAVMEDVRHRLLRHLDVGHQAAPEVVFFGTERLAQDPTRIPIPIELVAGVFFVLIALLMVGPGQVLGRTVQRIPDRVQAYAINIAGSALGVCLFVAASWAELSPFWWFAAIAALIAYLSFFSSARLQGKRRWGAGAALGGVVVLASLTSVGSRHKSGAVVEHHWSPYYRVDYEGDPRGLFSVNLIGHQQMIPRARAAPAYALPHLFRRAAKLEPFGRVLVIGAGSGNDVSRSLEWGASRVDAVEIDPVIQRLGARDHPDRPYQDPRVAVHVDDGRGFLRADDGRYDLIVYALVDSLVLHSSYSNIRLESYLFTREALEDVRNHLAPGGWFAVYNFFRQAWIVERLRNTVAEVFGSEPLVLTLPRQASIASDAALPGFTLVLGGREAGLAPLRDAFAEHGAFWLSSGAAPGPASPNGFEVPPPEERVSAAGAASDAERAAWTTFGPATLEPSGEPLGAATDDWPFLYLRRPMVPGLALRGIAVMALATLALIAAFGGRALAGRPTRLDGASFFLGAGFMLIETKAVVQMALVLGSTWIVNSVVFLGILAVILAANLLVLRWPPRRVWPWWAGLFATLALGWVVRVWWLGDLPRVTQALAASALLLAPVLFAGVVFATLFAGSRRPERLLGFNVAGAILGGWLENLSMVVGFAALAGVALAIYALAAALTASRGGGTTPASSPPP